MVKHTVCFFFKKQSSIFNPMGSITDGSTIKMMLPGKIKFNPGYFIVLYTLLNFVQIFFTELTSDEAYYWFYSLNIDWGHYDHPPVIGVLTFLGRLLSDTEFGIRVVHTLTISVGLIFLFKMIPDEQKFIAGIIVLAMPLFNYISFILFPDTALVGISAILIYAYRQFLSKNDLQSALLLGLLLGGALLCKYHAVLIPFFIVLSNVRLLKNRLFYVSVFFAFLIFIPHLIWQYNHDFVTFRYHLTGRNTAFKPDYFFEYIANQVVVIGIGILFIPFIFKPTDPFEKSLKYITVGTFIFFALSSIKGYVHLHWTSIALVPIILMTSRFYSSRTPGYLFTFSVVPFIGVVLFARIYLMYNFLSVNHLNVDYYHDRPLWAEDISRVTTGRPVVFDTKNIGLRESPMYAFY